MKVKKHYIFVICGIIMMMACAAVSAAQPEIKNLAEGKSIISNNLPPTGFSVSNLTDGDTATMSEWICSNMKTDPKLYATIDLGDEYNITQIQLYGRQDQNGAAVERYDFEIQFSNSPDFEEYETVSGPAQQDDIAFPPKGCFKKDVTLTGQYRYVKLVKHQTDAYWYLYYNELKVMGYGDTYEKDYTLVSADKTAITDQNYPNLTGELALNSTVDGSNRWLYYGNEAYHYMIVDLEKAYNIGYIEIEKFTKSYDTFYENTYIYGCNAYDLADLNSDAAALDNTKYKVLAQIGKNPPEINKIECDDSGAFRYLIYRRGQKSDTEVGSFRAYVINPKIISYTADAGKIVLKFSDDMDTDTLNDKSVILKVDGKETAYNGTSDGKRKYVITFKEEIFDSEVSVSINGNAKNLKNVSAVEREAVSYTASSKLSASKFGFFDSTAEGAGELTVPADKTYVCATVKNNSTSSSQAVYLVIAAYDSNNTIVGIDSKRIEIGAGLEENFNAAVDITGISDLKKIKAYLWRNSTAMADCVPSISCEK